MPRTFSEERVAFNNVVLLYLQSKIRNLEMVAEEEKQKTVQIQLLKQEKSKLISQLTAQESLIDGLKAERKIWGQELTQQGKIITLMCTTQLAVSMSWLQSASLNSLRSPLCFACLSSGVLC